MIRAKSYIVAARCLCFVLPAISLFFQSCTSARGGGPNGTSLKTITIIDRNGMSETISNPERIKQYQSVDFQSPQPYEKVLLINSRDKSGNVPCSIYSYHENGQPKQYLEVVNSRAQGFYREWFPSGCLKLQAYVIGGEADLSAGSEKSWLFDGHAYAWDEEGRQLTDILYEKGALCGCSTYYHANGNIWRKIPYRNNQIHGTIEVYLDNGQLFQTAEYVNGKLHGPASRYWPEGQIASEEMFDSNALTFGKYFDQKGSVVSEVNRGEGYRAVFGKSELAELHQICDGLPEGEVRIFGTDRKLIRKFHVKNNQKHGEEVEYYDLPNIRHIPMLSLTWYEGKVQGIAKTWYENGTQESSREMSNNQKNGISSAWYRDGGLMLVEEYDQNKVIKGEYYRRGEKRPISEIKKGIGTATLFDPEGNFLRKIYYENGTPTGAD